MTALARKLWAAAKIGWAIESNWTYTWAFVLYSAVRPLTLCLVLYFLYRIAFAKPGAESAFMGVYTANAFFTLVIALTSNVTWIIINDREQYYVIRYVYVAPTRFLWYILGRSVPILGLAISSLLILMVFGRYALKIPVSLAGIRWGMLLPSLGAGLIATAALGVFFGGFCLVTARHSILLAEGAHGVFLLLCGVIFPIDILPPALRVAGLGLPLTYWMEATRRAFGVYNFSPILEPMSDLNLNLIMLASTALLVGLTLWAFNAFEHHAKKHGKIDQTTNY